MAKKVLIVEDERPLARALELKLRHEGCEVTVAYDGKEALDQLTKNVFDVMLLDIIMPVVDGIQLLQKIPKDRKPEVFVLSNLNQSEDESQIMDLGVSKYFVKSDTPLSVIVEEIKNS